MPKLDERLTVFEIRNDTLKEVFVGSTSMLMIQLIAEHRRELPPTLKHWNRRHKVSYHSLEFSVPADVVRRIIASYADSARKGGWKVLS